MRISTLSIILATLLGEIWLVIVGTPSRTLYIAEPQSAARAYARPESQPQLIGFPPGQLTAR